MTNWQYKIDRASLDAQSEVTDAVMEQLLFRLNDLGAKGWEAFQLIQGPHHINAVLKKPGEAAPPVVEEGEAPVCDAPPVLNRATAVPGDMITCQQGTWAGATAFANQWQRNGIDIPGEDDAVYTVLAEDVDMPVSCMVTASNDHGSTQATSDDCMVTAGTAATLATKKAKKDV